MPEGGHTSVCLGRVVGEQERQRSCSLRKPRGLLDGLVFPEGSSVLQKEVFPFLNFKVGNTSQS